MFKLRASATSYAKAAVKNFGDNICFINNNQEVMLISVSLLAIGRMKQFYCLTHRIRNQMLDAWNNSSY